MTSMRGAAYTVLSGLMTISDEDFTRLQRAEITDLITRGRERTDEIEALFFSLYPRIDYQQITKHSHENQENGFRSPLFCVAGFVHGHAFTAYLIYFNPGRFASACSR